MGTNKKNGTTRKRYLPKTEILSNAGIDRRRAAEAQNIAEIVLDAETRIGELLREIPKVITGRPAKSECIAAPTFTPKQQARDEIGISSDQAKRYVKLAENKPIVEAAPSFIRHLPNS